MNGLAEFFRTLGPARLAAMATVAAIVIGFFILIITRVTTPNMALLFSGLDPADSAKIVQRLESQNIPYKLTGNGGSIMVPEDQVLRLRVDIAGQGLASGGGSIGNEIFDRNDSLGTTSFVQNINRLRALEGELARTIQSMDRVISARIHIVMPERRLFSNESRDATASIFVKTKNGRLSRAQIQAVQNLVSAAVPDLQPERISIVDQRGSLLARGSAESAEGMMAASMAERKISLENRLRQQVESLLEKTVGLGKVRAEVSTELDLNRFTSNSEIYDPDGQVIISQSISESSNSRQENADQAEISVANNLPDADAATEEPGIKNQSSDTNTQETTNYAISKTLRTEIHEGGSLKKISIAVLVDGTYQDQGEDSPPVYQARSDEELEQLETLVKTAIGFDEERGDTVSVINMQFAEVDYGAELAEEGLFSFGKGDLKWGIELGLLTILGILVILFGLRPLISYMTAPAGEGLVAAGPAQLPPGEEAAQLPDGTDQPAALAAPDNTAVVSTEHGDVYIPKDDEGKTLTARQVAEKQGIESAIDVASVEGKLQATAVKKVGELVERHPDEAAAVVREWLYG